MRRGWVIMALTLVVVAAIPAAAQDRHAGYYYPVPATIETYTARTIVMPDASRETRLGFIIGITQRMLSRPYPPRVAMFAKGSEAEKLIIVALEDDYLDTLYRSRAFYAMLTSIARTTPFIQELGPGRFPDLLRPRQAARLREDHHLRRRPVRPSGAARVGPAPAFPPP